jgi:2-polyprenyl-3-methyl-5-hydroxy-6-metoxy-1,4-benzoquinol methylase
MDKQEAKTKQLESWTAVAAGWNKHEDEMGRTTAPVAQRMINLAGIKAGARVLDVASGVGEPALTIAQTVGPTGSVLGTDLVPDMVSYAQQRASARSIKNIEFRHADGERLEVDGGPFDAVTIRWGLMFMPDPLACLRRAHALLRPSGRIAVTVWGEPTQCPFVTAAMGVLKQHLAIPDPPPGAPGIFAFASTDRLRGALAEAGFREITIEQMSLPVVDVATGEEYESFIREIAGPVASLFAQLPADKQAIVKREIAAAATKLSAKPGRVVLFGAAHLAAAVK